MTTLPSRAVLAAAPNRVLSFLYGVASEPTIWALMASRGYDEREHAHGWALLQRAGGFVAGADAPRSAAVVATQQLDAWDEPNFAAYEAALRRLFPEQADFVFHELTPSKGPAAVLGVQKFLDRVAALETGKSPPGDTRVRPADAASRKADRRAVALLAERGLTEEVRTALTATIRTAQTLPDAPPVIDDVTSSDEEIEPTEQDKALGDLHAWWQDWSSSARVVLKKRSQLIRVGLAERRRTKADGGEGGGGTGGGSTGGGPTT